MNMFRNESTITFTPYVGAPEISELTRVKLAKEIKPDWLQKQKGTDQKFSMCPGMDDWLKTGYIIPAWTDIHIKANRAGTVVKLYKDIYPPLNPMDERYVKGIIEVDDNVKFAAYKLCSPWSVSTKSGYSAHVLPALFHSPFLRDLYLYPGTVDYDMFNTINVMFSPIRECEFTIEAGTPLLHVIPFKRERISGECGQASEYELRRHNYAFPTRVVSAYRKFFHKKKHYSLRYR